MAHCAKTNMALPRLPRNSHSRLITLIANCLPLFDAICKWFLKFADSCINSDSIAYRLFRRFSGNFYHSYVIHHWSKRTVLRQALFPSPGVLMTASRDHSRFVQFANLQMNFTYVDCVVRVLKLFLFATGTTH